MDVKKALIFVSFSIRLFLVNFGINIFFFTLLMLLTMPVFFLGAKLSGNHWVFAGFSAIMLPVSFFLKSILFKKHRLLWCTEYARFLPRLDMNTNTIAPEAEGTEKFKMPANWREVMTKAKSMMISNGMKRIPFRLVLSLSAFRLASEGNTEKNILPETFNGEKNSILKRRATLVNLTAFLLFLLLVVPFGAVSLLFTSGADMGLQMIIYVMGILFAWFLFSVVVIPISDLVYMDRVTENFE